MRKTLVFVLIATLFISTLTGCGSRSENNTPSTAGSGTASASGNSTSATPQTSPANPTSDSPSAGNSQTGNTGYDGDLNEEEIVYTVVGPESIVHESPILAQYSAEDQDLFLRMNETSIGRFSDRYSQEEMLKFSEFLFRTVRIDFDRRIALLELEDTLRYIDGTDDPIELVGNHVYLEALWASCFWEKQNEDLVYNNDLLMKFAYGGGHLRAGNPRDANIPADPRMSGYPYGINPIYLKDREEIIAPAVVPFDINTLYAYSNAYSATSISFMLSITANYPWWLFDMATTSPVPTGQSFFYVINLNILTDHPFLTQIGSGAPLNEMLYDALIAGSNYVQIVPIPDEIPKMFD